jgi:hypothetical protein
LAQRLLPLAEMLALRRHWKNHPLNPSWSQTNGFYWELIQIIRQKNLDFTAP